MYAGYRRRLELVIQYEGASIADEKAQKSTAKTIAIPLSELVIPRAFHNL